jgi:LysR family transcriptional regulator, hydrogen peroxide-inducible genes activator
VVLMPINHPLANHESISQEDLIDQKVLLLGEGHCFRDQVLTSCPSIHQPSDENHTNIRTAAEGSSLETLRHMVASGLGITILPQSAASSPLYSSHLLVTRPLANPAPSRTVALAWRASFPRHKAIDALRTSIQMARSTLKNKE